MIKVNGGIIFFIMFAVVMFIWAICSLSLVNKIYTCL